MNTVELISTGSELLNGRTVNRHAQTLAQYLSPLGLRLVRDTTVPDDPNAMREALEGALRRVGIVFMSGGLGPTQDDVTRDVVADFVGQGTVTDPEALENIRRKCRKRGLEINEARERQALIVEGATALQNSVGAAPGERLEIDGKVLFLMPGPPREFEAVLTECVVPWLREQLADVSSIEERIFMVCGMAEADILTCFQEAEFPPRGIDAAFCAAPGRVEVRLSAASGAEAKLEAAAARVRRMLGHRVFSEAREGMEEVVGRLLKEKGATLATAESCTGGLVGHRITSVSGSSSYYAGGVVAYADEVKIRELGVDEAALEKHGAVSEVVAGRMAGGVRERFGTDYGIGITGIAGPAGGTSEKPVGLVFIGVAGADRLEVRQFRFSGSRAWIKDWSSQVALDMLRLFLLGVPIDG